MPQDWEESIIVSLYKKGDEEKVTNYRGISYIVYKIYVEVIRNRLKRKMET